MIGDFIGLGMTQQLKPLLKVTPMGTWPVEPATIWTNSKVGVMFCDKTRNSWSSLRRWDYLQNFVTASTATQSLLVNSEADVELRSELP